MKQQQLFLSSHLLFIRTLCSTYTFTYMNQFPLAQIVLNVMTKNQF